MMDAAIVAQRAAHRALFARDVALGRAEPFVLPYTLLACHLVPAVWLAVPHANRPWLYRSRWLIVAFVIAVNCHLIRRTSSENFGFAYITGLSLTWGIVTCVDLLILRTPQRDEARILKVPATKVAGTNKAQHSGDKGTALGDQETPRDAAIHSVNGDAASAPASLRRRHDTPAPSATKQPPANQPDGETYIWQPYPHDASFLCRLGWTFDLMTSLRGAGWNTAITTIPNAHYPAHIAPGDAVDISAMPRVSRSGYERFLSEGQFVRKRLVNLLVCYLIIDLLTFLCSRDPYFILGPKHKHETPPYLSGVAPWLLLVYRELAVVTLVVSALEVASGLYCLCAYYLFKIINPPRAVLWHFPSTFGSFSQIPDRGLAGFWGAWWHQVLRQGFLSPITALVKRGYMDPKSKSTAAAAVVVCFTLSGLLHAMGSITCIADTKPLRPFAFFFLQGVGIMTQQALGHAMRASLHNCSRLVARSANFLFSLAWLYVTAPLFLDDLAANGIWLTEIFPVSLFRLLGLIPSQGREWWRWSVYEIPRWHTGKHWWQSGFAI